MLGFWLLHARLKYNSLQNYGPTICMIHERQKEYRLSYTIAKVERGQRSGVTDHWNRAAEAEQSFEKMEQVWEETQGEVDQVMGSRIGPKEKGTKEAWVVQNKELTRGSGPEADSYGTRSEDGISKATWIGNRVVIGNWSGINREWRQLLNCEGEGYAGAEGRLNERDSDQKP